MILQKFRSFALIVSMLLLLLAGRADAATLTVQTNVLGPTPALLGYNLGHYYPGSMTPDWWRYSGVTGARIFIAPSQIESSSSIQASAGLVGVSNAASFLSARASMHTNQFNPAFIGWTAISNNYANNDLAPVNHIKINYALGSLRSLGVQICAQITATPGSFAITGTNDWAGAWSLWHHYYAQAFYLGRVFDVQRYQMYNEPNNDANVNMTNYFFRLQLASDAIQAALADVNSLYGKSLTPMVLAPVLAGNAISAYPTWGTMVVTNRHLNFLNQTDTNFLLFQKYDYHQYGATPSGFGGNLASLNADLQSDMAPETPFLTTVSEFDTRTAASFDSTTITLDTPTEYSKFGGITTELMSNLINEAYCFKFSQVTYSGNYPVEKNALHYVDNSVAPYNIGGITRAGEVYRLFNQAFAPGRNRLAVTADADAAALETCASYDPVTQRYYLFSANNNNSNANLTIDLSALNLPAGNRVLISEVSETNYGAGLIWTNLPANSIFSAVQGSNTVWLVTIPSRLEQTQQIVSVTGDAEVRDGANQAINFGSATTMTARSDATNSANRRAAFMKFHLPVTNLNAIEFAVLSFQAASTSNNTTAQAHVYGLTNAAWSPSTVTWSTAPNLRQNVAAGVMISNDVVTGLATNAGIVGQVVTTSTNASEKLIDVTSYLKAQTNLDFSFVVAQEPRWNVALPSLSTGDPQTDGVQITTSEGGSAPRLLLALTATILPTATNDTYSTAVNTSLSISAPGVLANDANATSAALTTTTAHGSLTLNTDGSFLYQPTANYSGSDSFTYTAVNTNGSSAPATASLTVLPATNLTTLTVATEASVRGGANADMDQDEVGIGYLLVKYYPPPYDSARKGYFQFDATGLNVSPGSSATFTVNFAASFKQDVQLWALNQAYTNFTSAITWNMAQANDLTGNDLLATGTFTATAIGAVTNIPTSGTSPYSFTIPLIQNYIQSNKITLALGTVTNFGTYLNDAGGLRITLNTATLQLLTVPPPAPPQISGLVRNPNGSVTMNFQSAANGTFRIQATTNLASHQWLTISTNTADGLGHSSFMDPASTNLTTRFYRAVMP